MAQESRLSGYKISEGPVTSSSLPPRDLPDEMTELQAHYGKPLLVAIARDPQTLFVCWSVDWRTAFTKGLPSDRSAHVRIRQNTNEKVVAVEPMNGSCVVNELSPGEIYSVELGYYVPAETWNCLVIGNEVMMPLASVSAAETIEVASVPFHLTFQRILEALGRNNGDDLTDALARFQEEASHSELPPDESGILGELNLSREDLQKRVTARESLEKSEWIGERGGNVFGGSPCEGFGGSSW